MHSKYSSFKFLFDFKYFQSKEFFNKNIIKLIGYINTNKILNSNNEKSILLRKLGNKFIILSNYKKLI